MNKYEAYLAMLDSNEKLGELINELDKLLESVTIGNLKDVLEQIQTLQIDLKKENIKNYKTIETYDEIVLNEREQNND